METAIRPFLPLFAALALGAQAAPDTVTALQMPAWLLRQGQQRPLAAGQRLQDGDLLIAGKAARIELALGEGGVVRLAEASQLQLGTAPEAGQPPTRPGAAFELRSGAVHIIARPHGAAPVDIRLQLGEWQANIAQAEVWASQSATGNLLCVIKGRVAFADDAQAEAPACISSDGTAPVPGLAADWAAQTGLAHGKGQSRIGGQWRLIVAVVADQDEALSWYDRLQAAGYAARLRPISGNRYRVGMEQLASEADAEALGARLHAELATPQSLVLSMQQ